MQPVAEQVEQGTKVAGLRWLIIGLVFVITLINFIDRLTLSVLAPVLVESLRLSNVQYASLATWFLLAYSVSQALSGRLYDAVGNRTGFSLSVVVWSVAAMLHATASGLASLSVYRFLLGLGEAGNWPGAAKVVGEWFPARERAFALAIFNSGAALGSVVAPPLIVWLQLNFGWKATFLATGSAGFVWLVAWLAVYRPLAQHPWLTESERALITENRPVHATAEQLSGGRLTYREVLRLRTTWAIILARFCCDPVWWFYITWLPLYLYRVHGFDLKEIGAFAWVPFVAADAGSLLGGWASGYLLSRGWSLDRARKTILVASTLLMTCGLFGARSNDPVTAMVVIAVVLFGFQAWINNVQVLPSDLYAPSNVATVAGLGGLGAGIGAMLLTLTTGWVVDHFSYQPILIAAGLLPILGTSLLFGLGGRFTEGKASGTERAI